MIRHNLTPNLLNRILSLDQGVHESSSNADAQPHTNSAQKGGPIDCDPTSHSSSAACSGIDLSANAKSLASSTLSEGKEQNLGLGGSDESLIASALSRAELYRRHGLTPSHFAFACIFPECDQHFSLTRDLYAHIRSHDSSELSESGSRLHVCSYCDTKFNNLVPLVRHVRIHTHHKPYICPFPNCECRYAAKHEMKVHLLARVHQLSHCIYVSRETNMIIILPFVLRTEMSPQLLNAILSSDMKCRSDPTSNWAMESNHNVKPKQNELDSLRCHLEIAEKERDQWKKDYYHLANILGTCREYTNRVDSQHSQRGIDEPAAKKRRITSERNERINRKQDQTMVQKDNNLKVAKKSETVCDSDGDTDGDVPVDLDLVFESKEPTRKSNRDKSKRPVYTESHSNKEWWLWW